jgi:hypothetical protein
MTIPNQELNSGNDDAKPAAAGDGARLTRIALFVVLFLTLALVAVLAVEMFVAERVPELTPERLSEAEQRWAEKGPASYDLDLVIEGAQPGVVHVEVRDGVTTAMQRDGRTPKQQRVWDVWNVPGMFDTIEREFDLAADPVHEMQANANPNTRLDLRAAFNAEFGYPERFHRIVFGGGPEVYWRVTSFQPK